MFGLDVGEPLTPRSGHNQAPSTVEVRTHHLATTTSKSSALLVNSHCQVEEGRGTRISKCFSVSVAENGKDMYVKQISLDA